MTVQSDNGIYNSSFLNPRLHVAGSWLPLLTSSSSVCRLYPPHVAPPFVLWDFHASLVLTLSTTGFFSLDGWAGVVLLGFLDEIIRTVRWLHAARCRLTQFGPLLATCLLGSSYLGKILFVQGWCWVALLRSRAGPRGPTTHWAGLEKSSWPLG